MFPTSDEKVMAALAHGSILLMFFGPVVPLIVWATQRKKSKYVAFQALQAMGYQALLFWLWIAVGILAGLLVTCLLIPFTIFLAKNADHIGMAAFTAEMVIFFALFTFMGLFFLTGIAGALFCLLGRDFRYPLIGKWLERYLSYQADSDSPIEETREDNWVAAVCHAVAALQVWGIVTPLIVWLTQKERSVLLRFQAMQAFVYQGVALAVYMGGMALYMLSFFGMFLVPILGGVTDKSREMQGPAGPAMLTFFGIAMILWLVIMLLMPVYYLLAAFASVRVLQGRPFHYPILGGILERRMNASPKPELIP